jgi:hypothetical protein
VIGSYRFVYQTTVAPGVPVHALMPGTEHGFYWVIQPGELLGVPGRDLLGDLPCLTLKGKRPASGVYAVGLGEISTAYGAWMVLLDDGALVLPVRGGAPGRGRGSRPRH